MNGSVERRVTAATNRANAEVAGACVSTSRGPAFFEPGAPPSAQPSPRTRVSRRLVSELAARGLRHLVPLVLVLAAEAQGNACALSQAEVARRLALDVRSVRRQEDALERLGLLRVVRGGPRNRRLVVIEDLDAQVVTRSAPAESLHPVSPNSPQFAPEPGHGCPVSSARETGHAEAAHIRLARTCARAESPLSVSSGSGSQSGGLRTEPAAPWGPWRARQATAGALGRGARMPEWPGPSAAVDERAAVLHRRLGMWANTLREVVLCARDHARRQGEAETLRYLESLERHCLLKRRNPAGSALNGLRKWITKIGTSATLPRQHVIEDVGAAKSLGGLLQSFLPREVRHA